ncbi:MAG: flagellar basal body P-ring formation chaperone FlgA [Bdellovibrionota bacterium]
MKKRSAFLLAAVAAWVSLTAASPSIDSRPTVIVPPQVVVKGDKIALGDLAQISAREKEFQPLVEQLKEIAVGEAPPPKGSMGIPGARLLELIRAHGIPPETIGYSLPQMVQVERAGRVITNEELLAEVQTKLSHDTQLEIQVREVLQENAQIIPLGAPEFEIERLGEPSAGKIPLRVMVQIDKKPVARFMATAVVDDWREVPVLNKTLERGMLITPQDVELVRLNLFKQPPDVADQLDEVVGRTVKSRMPAGNTLRKSMIDIPPLVTQGKKLTLVYSYGALRATASGLSMDDGLKGDVIRVKNDSSKKIVRAKIISEDQAEVEAQ